ncbi:MAG TPA: serine hydrolase [Thermoanaerobaculia bacterium]|nr:serine hydrolase [Thermoanaerobaculia bacterium]
MTALLLALLFSAKGPHAGASAERLLRIDAVVRESVANRELPGAVVLVGHRGKTVFRKAFGNRAVEPVAEPMTVDTVFDLASLTKAVATAPSVMILIEEGKLRLSDPVVKFIPEFGAGGGERDKVTVEHLLTHRAGFSPDDALEIYTGTPEEIFARKYRQPLQSSPGSRFTYSDVGYEVLGELVRRVSGEPLDRFAQERIFKPLGMRETFFNPLPPGEGRVRAQQSPRMPIVLSRVAPTERREGRWMRGEVHDPRAYALGGVAGHAGLFSTAEDLAKFCRMILEGGRRGRARVLSPNGVEAMTRPRFYGDESVRALGFDIATSYSRNRGDLFPAGSFGHTGFTGTSLWIDPSSETFVVFLSNRGHPDGKGDVGRLRGLVSTIVAAAVQEDVRGKARTLAARVPRPSREVSAGIDVLAAEGFRSIAGLRIGLVTNATGRARDGRSTIEVLTSPEAKKAGVTLVRLFSPEHGLRTDADALVPSGSDSATGLPVVSLYEERRRPKSAELSDLDALVLDIQDVGTRFYTYITTAGYLVEEAAKAKIPLVVLDRPDPIGGTLIEGPPADSDKLSFTAYHAIPVRYGMTPGEMALLVNAEKKLGADVRVVKMRGWSRHLWYDETGLEWVNPSPNMRSLAAAALYSGIGLLETTNLSVGRGTETPFEVIGAPWLDGRRLSEVLAAHSIPGARFSPVHFTPASSVFAGQRCGGIRIDVVDREALRSVSLGIEIAAALRDLYPVDWERKGFVKLLANGAAFERLEKGDTAPAIVGSWQKDVEEFEKRRAKSLLY